MNIKRFVRDRVWKKRILNFSVGLLGAFIIFSTFSTSFSLGIFGALLIAAALIIERKEFEHK